MHAKGHVGAWPKRVTKAPMTKKEPNDNKTYDCPDCQDTFDSKRGRSIHHTRVHDGSLDSKVECTCENCGSTFREWEYRVEDGDGKYCSTECRDEGVKDGQFVECSWCGNEFYKPKTQLHQMGDYDIDNHFCDKECETQFKRHNWVREGHPNWQGGNSGINAVRKMLSPVSWQETARQVRQDANGCYICGGESESRDLDVHHIIPVSAGGTNEEWNLMALCQSCHRRVERYTEQIVKPYLYDLSRRFAD